MEETDSVNSWATYVPAEERTSEWTRSRERSEKKKKLMDETQSRRCRELNKTLKTIYDDEEAVYGEDTLDEEELERRTKEATEFRQKSIATVFRRICLSRNVELCFLVDATGSMQRHIDEVKNTIYDIVSKLTDTSIAPTTAPSKSRVSYAAQEMKLAFVAYRDHKDKKQFEIFSFSKSIDDFKTFCGKLKAEGGDDTAEDVFGGLENAIDLNWSDEAGTKVIFHICDAPCHGKEFYEGNANDFYPDGDPKGRSHIKLFSLIRERGIQYHFGKINYSTNRMIFKFSEAYGEPILAFDISEIKNIRDSVIRAVSDSIDVSVQASKGPIGRKVKPFEFDKNEPDWDALPTITGLFMTYDLPNNIEDILTNKPLGRRNPNKAEVIMAKNPFDKGAERVAYYGVDVSPSKIEDDISLLSFSTVPSISAKNKKIVLKEYLHEGRGANSYRRFELSNQLQTISAYLARKFSEVVKSRTGYAENIKFLKIRTFKVDGQERYYSCERRFGSDSKFVRFTNNTTYEMLENKAMALGIDKAFIEMVVAFSHWTFKVTNGYLMVVDLQGVLCPAETGETQILLTDPAIHCTDVTRFGRMNHGEKGMENFFSSHICNSFCKPLEIDKFKMEQVKK